MSSKGFARASEQARYVTYLVTDHVNLPVLTSTSTMSSVYYPAHVVLVLRRIVNVISTFSISNNCLLSKSTITDSDRGTVVHSTVNAPPSVVSSSPFVHHNDLWWPWSFRRHDWNWISLETLSSTTLPQQSCTPGVTSLAEGTPTSLHVYDLTTIITSFRVLLFSMSETRMVFAKSTHFIGTDDTTTRYGRPAPNITTPSTPEKARSST